ncbi:uncharacterized protein LOC110115189 [Dendrobium catenatum]|uniref:Methyltransferase n=1 Tax=Dendrobium catenatum TaxID=906689 RepID=A0A2I0W0V9_9ASPA|nr:uncharacterized protein LOC110115189 [Dendrobium catenatum]PKU69287.1 putative methyltransferase PMT27 [Dendrobium catenatum]
MNCGRRSAVDDVRSRRTRAVDEDRRRIRWAVDEDRHRKRWTVDDDRRHEPLWVAQVIASLDRMDDLCVKFMHSVERTMSRSATIPASSLLCSSNTHEQPTQLQRDPSLADFDFMEENQFTMSRADPPSEPTHPPSLQIPVQSRDSLPDETTAATTAQAKPASRQNSQPRRPAATPTSPTAADQASADQTPAHIIRRSTSESRVYRDLSPFDSQNPFPIPSEEGFRRPKQDYQSRKSPNTKPEPPRLTPCLFQRSFETQEFFPEPKRLGSLYGELEKRLRMRGIQEPARDLETLKQTLKRLRIAHPASDSPTRLLRELDLSRPDSSFAACSESVEGDRFAGHPLPRQRRSIVQMHDFNPASVFSWDQTSVHNRSTTSKEKKQNEEQKQEQVEEENDNNSHQPEQQIEVVGRFENQPGSEVEDDETHTSKSDDRIINPDTSLSFFDNQWENPRKSGDNRLLETQKIHSLNEGWKENEYEQQQVGINNGDPSNEARFGGCIFSRDIITMSFTPKDEREAQVLFDFERGIRATSAVMSSQQLPFPNKVFDFTHCARCRVPWHADGGMLLLELNWVLRPGGYFVWFATPVYQKLKEDLEIWKAMSSLTKSMGWDLVTIEKDKLKGVATAIYRKPTSNEYYENYNVGIEDVFIAGVQIIFGQPDKVYPMQGSQGVRRNVTEGWDPKFVEPEDGKMTDVKQLSSPSYEKVATNIKNKIFDPGGLLSSVRQCASTESGLLDARGV